MYGMRTVSVQGVLNPLHDALRRLGLQHIIIAAESHGRTVHALAADQPTGARRRCAAAQVWFTHISTPLTSAAVIALDHCADRHRVVGALVRSLLAVQFDIHRRLLHVCVLRLQHRYSCTGAASHAIRGSPRVRGLQKSGPLT
jgi:hypothetical protein